MDLLERSSSSYLYCHKVNLLVRSKFQFLLILSYIAGSSEVELGRERARKRMRNRRKQEGGGMRINKKEEGELQKQRD